MQDWIIRPQLKEVAGVAEIERQRQLREAVPRRAGRPRAHGVWAQLARAAERALERNNLTTGAGFVEHNGESTSCALPGGWRRRRLATLPVAERGGVPCVGDLARRAGSAPRTGSAANGEEVVLGTALMLVGANSRTVSMAVGSASRTSSAVCPPTCGRGRVLDRSSLVDATIATVARNLAEGALLVVIVLFLMLGNFRAALITALAIPLSMLLTAIGMVQTKTSGNLMSLGAIDFGLIVDGAVIIVENCLRRLAGEQRRLGRALTTDERLATVFTATKEVRGATAFGEAIIVTVYVPILALTGVEGKMFHPMALTVIFALTAAFVLSLTFVPAMVALMVRAPVREEENRVVRAVRHLCAPLLARTLRWPGLVVTAAVTLFAGSLLLFGRLGQEFVPTLSEARHRRHGEPHPEHLAQRGDRDAAGARARARGAGSEAELVFSRTGTADTRAIRCHPISPIRFWS